jgi:Holliday junction DNA helicase RuvB
MSRPKLLTDIVGQEHLIKILKIRVDAAKNEGQQLGHILLEGAPGLGKTSIAMALANELGADLKTVNGATTAGFRKLLPLFTELEEGDIVFIDEIHQLQPKLQEFLYPILEDGVMHLVGEETLSVDIPPFTLIGATTHSGMLNRPFYDRFNIRLGLSYYDDQALAQIILRNLEERGLTCDKECGIILARTSRGTPRVALNRTSFCADFITSQNRRFLSKQDVEEALKLIQVEPNGLEKDDKLYIMALKALSGGPASLATISSMIGVAETTLINAVEPFLLRQNLIVKTPRGRMLLEKQGI